MDAEYAQALVDYWKAGIRLKELQLKCQWTEGNANMLKMFKDNLVRAENTLADFQ